MSSDLEDYARAGIVIQLFVPGYIFSSALKTDLNAFYKLLEGRLCKGEGIC